MTEILKPAGAGEERSGVSRRTVLAGAAWTVPTVVVASALPAHGVGLSQEQPPVSLTSLQAACKFSSSKAYHFELVFTNTTSNYFVTVSDLELDAVPNSGTDIVFPATIPSKRFAPGETFVLVVNSYSAPNAASFDLNIRYDWATSVNANMNPVLTTGDFPADGGWFFVGRPNTPDCSSVKPPYEAYNAVPFAQWFSPPV